MKWKKESLLQAADLSRRFCCWPFSSWFILLGVDPRNGYVYAVPTTDISTEFDEGIIRIGQLHFPMSVEDVINICDRGWRRYQDRQALLKEK